MFIEGKTIAHQREYVNDIKTSCDEGTVYIGRDDDGSVCGESDANTTMLRAASALRDAIRPDLMMFVDCRYINMDSKTVYQLTTLCLNDAKLFFKKWNWSLILSSYGRFTEVKGTGRLQILLSFYLKKHTYNGE